MTRRFLTQPAGDFPSGLAWAATVLLSAIALVIAFHATETPAPSTADRLASCRGVAVMRTAHLIGGVDVLVPYPVTPGGGGVTNLTYIVVTDPACVQRITGKLPAGASGPFGGGMTSNHP